MKKSLFLLPLLAMGLVACGGNSGGGAGESAGGGGAGESAGGGQGGGGSSSLIATYDFTGLTGNGAEITDPQAALGSLGTAITWTSATKVYDGNGNGGVKPYTGGMLKFGTGSVSGVLSFTVNESVSRIVLNCHSFYAPNTEFPTNTKEYKVSVNEATPVLAPFNAAGDGEDVDITLGTASTSITITSVGPDGDNGTAGRFLLYSMSLYR